MGLFEDKITVLMPVYNSENTVGASIKSVLNQSYKNFNFIIVNDGSTDGSDSIIRSFTDDRIKYYVCEHEGRSTASNFGISKAETEYVARIDSDDLFFKDKLEKQVNYLKNNKSIDILFTWSIFYNKNMRLRYWKSPETDIEIKQRLMYLNPINHSSVVFRKKISEEVMSYNENMDVNEDYELWLRLSRKAVFHCIPEFLVFSELRTEDRNKQYFNGELKKLLVQNLINSGVEDTKELNGLLGKIEYYYGDIREARNHFSRCYIMKNFKHILLAHLPGSIQRKYRGYKYSMLFSTDTLRAGKFKRILKDLINQNV
ncbi:MAG: glycosyltransferase family 2 protein [Ignavibacteria bacterium]